VFGGKRSFDFKVDIALLNEQGRTIAKNTVTLKSGTFQFFAGDQGTTAPGGAMVVVRFPKVNINYLTPVLNVAISAVNGVPAQTLNSAGYMRISAGDLEGKLPYQAQAGERSGFVFINGGTFRMGDRDYGPRHKVTVSGFYMSKYEVTQKEWQEVMGDNPSSFKGDKLPVENVSWYDAVAYCNKRSVKENLTPAYTVDGTNVTWNRNANGYRLPTEAEWEYACRAGTTTRYYSGASVDSAGWYYSNSGNKTHEVGTKQANPWGLYDMSGNVWEWCWDWYGSYSSGAQTDPLGASSGAGRVSRGGSWNYNGLSLRSALRFYRTPSYRYDNLGFRLARPSL
jgi:formylglycine-generating enzyme required for sulfatase activity